MVFIVTFKIQSLLIRATLRADPEQHLLTSQSSSCLSCQTHLYSQSNSTSLVNWSSCPHTKVFFKSYCSLWFSLLVHPSCPHLHLILKSPSVVPQTPPASKLWDDTDACSLINPVLFRWSFPISTSVSHGRVWGTCHPWNVIGHPTQRGKLLLFL